VSITRKLNVVGRTNQLGLSLQNQGVLFACDIKTDLRALNAVMIFIIILREQLLEKTNI